MFFSSKLPVLLWKKNTYFHVKSSTNFYRIIHHLYRKILIFIAVPLMHRLYGNWYLLSNVRKVSAGLWWWLAMGNRSTRWLYLFEHHVNYLEVAFFLVVSQGTTNSWFSLFSKFFSKKFRFFSFDNNSEEKKLQN